MAVLDTLVCFESEAVLRAYSLAYPETPQEFWLTCDQLLERVLPAPPESRAAFESLLGENEKPDLDALWHTVRVLREAPILTRDDADFAFDSLPETPRNRALRDLMHRYLDSDLAFDRVARLSLLIERLRAGEVRAPAPCFVFVRSRDSRPLFADLARAFASTEGAESVKLVETWEWSPRGETTGKRRGVVVTESGVAGMESLTARAARWLDRGMSMSDLRLYFHGSEADATCLRLFLRKAGIEVRNLLDAPSPKALQRDKNRAWLISALRSDKSRELRERLRLASLLLGDRIDPRETLDEGRIDRLGGTLALSSTDLDYLKLLVKRGSQPAPAELPAQGALLLPLQPLARDEGTLSLTFAGKEVLKPEPDPLLLFKEGDKERLLQAGFHLPRLQEARARALRKLAALAAAAAGPSTLFTDVPATEWSAGRVTRFARRPRELTPMTPTPLKLPTQPLSATQAEAYAQCPAQYFYAHRLKLRPRESREERFALLFGQLAHRTLESVFRSNAGDFTPERLVREFERLIGEDPELRLPASDPLSIMLREQFERVARRVPEVEKQKHRLFGSFAPLDFERDFTIEIEGTKIRGKIDRVDRAPDGSILILDYKTGNVDFTPEHIRRGDHFQALLYVAAAEKLYTGPCVGVAFYDLKKGEIKRGWLVEEKAGIEAKKGFTRGHAMPEAKFDQLRADGIERLRELVAAIESGDFAPRPAADLCGRCRYSVFCRSNPELD